MTLHESIDDGVQPDVDDEFAWRRQAEEGWSREPGRDDDDGLAEYLALVERIAPNELTKARLRGSIEQDEAWWASLPVLSERSSWQAVDLDDVLDGRCKPPEPTVGRRNDGVGLFYPGRVHSVVSESEGGKTWFALIAAATEINAGHNVVYVDFEDSEGGVVGRLLGLGVDREVVRKRFLYVHPSESLLVGSNRDDLTGLLADARPTLAVLDGVTEAMSAHGLELKDNTDIARFGRMLPRWIADRGPAVAVLDHVVKDRDGRGRYALGGVHKLNGLDGAAYVLESRTSFGIGVTGRSTVHVAKDRPAQLRRHSVPSGEGRYWFADLVIESQVDGSVMPNLWPPTEKDEAGFRPTAVMAKVAAVLSEHSDGLSKNAIETIVRGNRAVVRTALELLVAEGYVDVETRKQAKMHTLVKAFLVAV